MFFFSELSVLESRLLARADPIIRIYYRGGPNGQLGYSGNIITIPKKLTSFINTIPRKPSNCHFYIIRKNIDSENKKDFIVRQWALRSWITFLLNNNDAYNDVLVDEDILSTFNNSKEGDIPQDIQTIIDDDIINKLNNLVSLKSNVISRNLLGPYDKEGMYFISFFL